MADKQKSSKNVKPTRRASYLEAGKLFPDLDQDQVRVCSARERLCCCRSATRRSRSLCRRSMSTELCSTRWIPTGAARCAPCACARALLARARARSLSVSSPSQIDAEELMEIFKELGMNPSREDVDKMIADVDADGSGEIGFTEFLTMMQSQSSTTDVVKKILGTFDRLDLDPHSILTRLEMSQIIQTMAEKLTDKETNALIDELEVNEDGDVTFDQLIYHMFSDKDQASNF